MGRVALRAGGKVMEDTRKISLTALFSDDMGSLAGKFSGIEALDPVTSLKTAFLEKAGGIKWSDIFSEVSDAAGRLLDMNIEDILIAAWKKHEEIKRYCDRKKYPSEETILCPLGRHKVKSVHHPYIEIYVNEESIGRMVFDLVLRFDLEGIILKIRDAKIMEIMAGKCKGSGSLKYGEVVLLKKESQKIPIPGNISLGSGIPIE